MENNLKPLLSIGISFYNNEKTLQLAINSVLKQTYTNWELILINDGSTDSSEYIAKSLISNIERVIFINDKINKGLVFRLNQMIDLSRGDFFVRFDSDDIMFPFRLEKQLDVFLEFKNIDIVASGAVIIDTENNITGLRNSLRVMPKKLISSPFIHPSVMGKISWFRENKYKIGFNRAEDLELWLRTYKHLSFYTIREPLIFYREGNINLQNYLNTASTIKHVYREYFFKNKLYLQRLLIKNQIKIYIYSFFGIFNLQYILASFRNKSLNSVDRNQYTLLLKSILIRD